MSLLIKNNTIKRSNIYLTCVYKGYLQHNKLI